MTGEPDGIGSQPAEAAGSSASAPLRSPRVDKLHQLPPTERRVAMRRLASAGREVIELMSSSSATADDLDSAAESLEAVVVQADGRILLAGQGGAGARNFAESILLMPGGGAAGQGLQVRGLSLDPDAEPGRQRHDLVQCRFAAGLGRLVDGCHRFRDIPSERLAGHLGLRDDGFIIQPAQTLQL